MNIFSKSIWVIVVSLCALSCGKEEIQEPIIDENGLFTDIGMVHPISINAVDVLDERVAGVIQYAEPIRSLTADESFEDLEFLAPLLDGKRIVQLGESGHGVRQFNQVKVRLIKHLHQNLGYDVIAFESSLFECYETYLNGISNGQLSGRGNMTNSIFRVWHTREVEELFEYINETQVSERPLTLAGFDVQSSSSVSARRPLFFKEILSHLDTAYANEIFDLDREVNSNLGGQSPDFFKDINELVSSYDALADYIEDHLSQLNAIYENSPEELHPLIAIQTAKSMSVNFRLLNASVRDETQLSIEIRDRGMANNVSFLADEVYPQSKLMIWAHNFHIRHDNKAVQGNYLSGYVSMGDHLHNDYEEEMYTIGLFMHSGSAGANDRSLYDIEIARRGSLEAIMHRTELKHCFLDFSTIPENEKTDWIYNRSWNKAWGVLDLQMIPKEQYDGILFIQNVTPPDYL